MKHLLKLYIISSIFLCTTACVKIAQNESSDILLESSSEISTEISSLTSVISTTTANLELESTETPSTLQNSSLESNEIMLSDLKFSPALQEFMQIINHKHETIHKPEQHYEKYVNPNKPDINLELHFINTSSNIDGTLTIEQIENDINILFYNLRESYGLYDYFGGDTKFYAAKEEILQECQKTSEITPETLNEILLKHMTFVKDGHFSLNGKITNSHIVPYFYKDIAFDKNEEGYFNKETKQQVQSIEGWENLDKLFKYSLSENGELVYYPIILHDYQKDTVLPDLKIVYTDGSNTSLSFTPFVPPVYDKNSPVLSFYEEDGIPILDYRKMGFDEKGDKNAQAFLNYAELLKNSSVMILDLRANPGQNSELSYKWFELYTEQKMAQNYFTIFRKNNNPSTSIDNNSNITGKTSIVGIGTILDTTPDVFVNNDNLLIILTSKYSASAAESFIDMAHNVKNTLIIGENTGGCLIGKNADAPLILPNSHLKIKFGDALHIFPENYFEDFIGLEPDIWVQSGDAKKAALQFIHSMMEE